MVKFLPFNDQFLLQKFSSKIMRGIGTHACRHLYIFFIILKKCLLILVNFELHVSSSLTCEGVTDVVASDDNEVGVAVVIAMGVAAIREEVGVAMAPEPARAFSAGCWREITTG